MYFQNALQTLEKNKTFKDWKKAHKHCKLSYGFLAIDPQLPSDWQLGYYDNKKDTITTFAMQQGKFVDSREDKVLKKKGAKVLPIDIKKVKLNVEQVLELVDKFQKKEYPNESSMKTIIIIQKLVKLGNVWNITIVTRSFKTINMKIDAEKGKVKQHSIASLLQKKK
tara:strand:- start:29827 stop:30327 length:501 start_codon:yes stop_codon:yes gene_type:complete